MFTKTIKSFLLYSKKAIKLEGASDINFNVINKGSNRDYKCRIINSVVHLTDVDEGCVISDSDIYGNVSLGRFVTITGPGTVLKALKEGIKIGSFTSIGQNVCIVDFNHHSNRVSSAFINHLIYRNHYAKDVISENVVIEEDVFIGSNSVILPGVKIGRGSIIGAGSIVNSDIPRYSVAVGNPVRVVKKRFSDDLICLLEELKWWDWDVERLKKNKNIFNIDLRQVNIKEFDNLIN